MTQQVLNKIRFLIGRTVTVGAIFVKKLLLKL
jgi:hypothetical protein